jgi:hypothetical protein
VALDLAGDRGNGEGGEADVALEVEALDRLDEAQRGNLLEVVERLALVGVAACQRAGERQRALDELQPGTLILVVTPASQQLAVVVVARHCGAPPLSC